MLTRLAALAAAAILACAPAAAQLDVRTLPLAATLTGSERSPAVQGSGCPSKTTPCANVVTTPDLIRSYVAQTLQAKDADLDALAALTGTSTIYYRSGANAWSPVTIGSNLTFSGGTLAATGGGGSGTVTGVTGTAPIVSSGGTAPAISITAASTSAAGSMSAADKTKLDAITGTNTGDQTSVSGNAGTATKWATARTLSFTGDATGSGSVDGSANVATTLTLATSGVTAGTYGSATAVPVPTIDAKGRVTSIATAALGTAAAQTYAEGTWTPTVTIGGSSAGITYSAQIGRYTRIGRKVLVEAQIVLTSKGSASGNVFITNLPFSATTALPSGISSVLSQSLSGVTLCTSSASGVNISLYNSTGSGFANLTEANLANNSAFYLTLTYTI